MKKFLQENSGFLIFAATIVLLSLLKISNANASDNVLDEFNLVQLQEVRDRVVNAKLDYAKKVEVLNEIDKRIALHPVQAVAPDPYYGIPLWRLNTMTPQMLEALRPCYTNPQGVRYCKSN